MDPLEEFEAEMRAQLESESAFTKGANENELEMMAMQEKMLEEEDDMIRIMRDSDALDDMEEDMAALVEAEASGPKPRSSWDIKLSKRRLTLNKTVNQEESAKRALHKKNKEAEKSEKLFKKKFIGGSHNLLPTLRVRMKENTAPDDIHEGSIFPPSLSLPESDAEDVSDLNKKEETVDNFCLNTVPVTGDYLPITLSSGDRYFVRVESESERKLRSKMLEKSIRENASEGALGASVAKLLEDLERKERQELKEKAAQTASAAQERQEMEDPQESGILRRKGAKKKKTKRSAQKRPRGSTHELWVDKYRPRRFTDLLSNDRTNREVLRWLKTWDPIVFPERKNLEPRQNSVLSTLMHSPSRKGKSPRARSRRTPRVAREPESLTEQKKKRGAYEVKYPEQKIILISGPPGLGKTTLAHIAARHAGYRVVEINASDDRAKNTLINKVQTATQMQSVFGVDSRPNCLVIDEIDGVCGGPESAGTIDALVKLAQVNAKRVDEQELENKKTRKSKMSQPVLSRPIICICNDPYTPALRPLRNIALQFVFEKPSSYSKLIGRLRHICRVERLETEGNALQLMCQSLNGDIRACLNMLQFIKNKARGSLTVDSMATSALGEKDVSRDRFDIWKSIFYRQPVRQEYSRGEGFDKRGQNRTKRKPRIFHRKTSNLVQVCNWISSHGDYEKVLEGAHFNYLNQPYMDVNLEQTAAASEWYSNADHLAAHSARTNGYSGAGAGRFVPFAAAAVYHYCSSTRPAYIMFPRAESSLRQSLRSKNNIARSFLSHKNKLAKDGISAHSMVLEMMSPLLDVITTPPPGFGSGRLTETQSLQMKKLIDTYISLGLSFTPSAGIEKGMVNDSTQSFRYSNVQRLELDPPINRMVEFGHVFPEICVPPQPQWKRQPVKNTSQPTGVRYIPHKFKENMRRDIEYETVRRNVAKQRGPERKILPDRVAKVPALSPILTAKASTRMTELEAKTKNKDSSMGKNKDSSMGKRKEKGCFLALARKRSRKKRRGMHSSRSKITYTFQEGFTNAVRRPVYVRDFLAL